MKNTLTGLLCLLTLSCAAPHTAVSAYKIANQIHLSGDGFWDYLTVDAATQRLFVSHGTQVQVVDLKTGRQAGVIPDAKGVHGIALAADLGKGFISCGRDTAILVFDLKTLTAVGKIKVTGQNPDAILYEPSTQRIFTFNHNGGNATVIDAVTDQVIGTIVLEGAPEFAVTDGAGTIFVNLEDKNQLAVLNAKTLQVTQKWALAPGDEPTGLAFDIQHSRLFSVCGNQKMVVIDAKSGKIIQIIPIGDGADGVAFDPETQRIYSSNGEGTLTVVDAAIPGHYKVLDTFTTQKGARTIALNPQTHHIYLPTAEFEKAVGDARPAIKPGTFVVLEITGK